MRLMKGTLATVGVVAVGATMIGCAAPPPHTWTAQLISVNGSGTDSGNGGSGFNSGTGSGGYPPGTSFVVSADGSTIAFHSYAQDLGPVDPDEPYSDDVYVRNLETGTTVLATPPAPGLPDGNADVRKMELSADGTMLVFTSAMGNLVPSDDNNTADVFVRDLVAATTELVSIDASGTRSANGASNDFSLSADGTKVAFTSFATNLGTPNRGDPYHSDVFLRDLTTGQTILLSSQPDGLDGRDTSWQPAFSPTGDAVAFVSADPLGFDGVGGWSNVFLFDLTARTKTVLSTTAPAPEPATTVAFSASRPVFRPDGGAVAYEVEIEYRVGSGTYSYDDVNVADLGTGAVELASAHSVPTDARLDGDRSARAPVFSPDGTKVMFETGASYFGPTDTNHDDFYRRDDLYVRDLVADTTRLVSVNIEGTDAMGGRDGAFSPDGSVIAFSSLAEALGAPVQIYLHEPSANRTVVLRVGTTAPEVSDSYEINPTFLAGGTRIAFVTITATLGPTDTNDHTDVYVVTGTRPTS